MDNLATVRALQDPQSQISVRLSAFLKDRMLIKLKHLRVPRLEDITIEIEPHEVNGKSVEMQVKAVRDGQMLGQSTKACAIILPAPSQKEINTRVHGAVIYELCQEIRESRYDDVSVLVDVVLYDYLQLFLTPQQIAAFLPNVHSGRYLITKTGDPDNVVDKVLIDTRGYCASARFNLAPGVAYDHGEIFIAGAMPATMTTALEGRPVYDVVQTDLFKEQGKITMAVAQKAQLRLVAERNWVMIDSANQAESHPLPITHEIKRVQNDKYGR